MEKKSLVLCDTDIIIEFYKEHPGIVTHLRSIGQENIAISIVTSGELLFGALNKRELHQIKDDIEHLTVIHLNDSIGKCFEQLMISYTLSHRLSVPDGLIAATAIVENIPLYTLNQKDFKYIAGVRLHDGR